MRSNEITTPSRKRPSLSDKEIEHNIQAIARAVNNNDNSLAKKYLTKVIRKVMNQHQERRLDAIEAELSNQKMEREKIRKEELERFANAIGDRICKNIQKIQSSQSPTNDRTNERQ